MAIVKANYLPQGPKTPAAAKRAARYYTYREGPDRSARQWYAAGRPGGELCGGAGRRGRARGDILPIPTAWW